MKRAALVFSVLSVLLFADGLWMEVAHYQAGTQNSLFGNPNINTSDGTTVLITAGLLTVVTAIMWLMVIRRAAKPAGERGGHRGSRPGSRA
jgi:branched-subunit amino acid ABC-type transport system permease component